MRRELAFHGVERALVVGRLQVGVGVDVFFPDVGGEDAFGGGGEDGGAAGETLDGGRVFGVVEGVPDVFGWVGG